MKENYFLKRTVLVLMTLLVILPALTAQGRYRHVPRVKVDKIKVVENLVAPPQVKIEIEPEIILTEEVEAIALTEVATAISNDAVIVKEKCHWNLFLAFIPWALTSTVMISPKLKKNKWILIPLLATWILFFPNAPYILTDLFHLRIETKVPIWYDLVLILSFAWTGLLYGLVSLFDIEKILIPFVKKRVVTAVSMLLLFISGFGIYIGRFLRWNSWDIMNRPHALLGDIADRFIDPASHPRTWAVTILMGVFLNMIYWSIRLLQRQNL